MDIISSHNSRLISSLLWAALAAGLGVGAGSAAAQSPRNATLLQPREIPPVVQNNNQQPPQATALRPINFQSGPALTPTIPPKTMAPAQPAPNGLTLDKLIELAATNNPELGAANARAGAARGQLIQAGLYPNPRVGWMGSQVLSRHNAAGEEGPLLLQDIVTGNKLQLSEQAAAHGVEGADWQAMTKWFDVVTRVRLAYYELLTARMQVQTSEIVEKLAKDGHNAALRLQKAGAGTRPDVLQSQVEVNQAALRVGVAKQREIAAQQLLAVAVGLQGLPTSQVHGNLEGIVPAYQWQPVVELTLTRSSEVQEALANFRQAEALLRRAHAEVCPNITAGIRPFYSFPDQDKRLMFEISMPLPVFNRNQGNIHSAEADVALARHLVRQVELKLEERLASAFQRYHAAHQQAEAYRLNILPQAKESLDLVRLAYERGDAKYDYAALLQAQRTVAQAELAHVQALGELWKAAVEIAGLIQE